MLKVLVLLVGISLSFFTNAWTPNGETVTIKSIIQWEGSGDIVFQTSGGHFCYIPSNEKEMYSLILSLNMAGKKARIHCHDATSNKGGYNSHRVHRVIVVTD